MENELNPCRMLATCMAFWASRTLLRALEISLNMLIETLGRFDDTGADCMGWMREAGFRDCRVEHLVGPDSMVVGIK